VTRAQRSGEEEDYIRQIVGAGFYRELYTIVRIQTFIMSKMKSH
jgi:hypothetical protein